MRDLFGSTTATTSSAQPPTQLELAGLADAITSMTRQLGQQSAALRKLFEDHGYDLANGDVLYHGPGLTFTVPPQYRAQVVQHRLLEGTAMWFAKNPRFSLF